MIKYFANPYFVEVEWPIVFHSKEATSKCYLFIANNALTKNAVHNNVIEKIEKGLIVGIIGSQETLNLYQNYEINLIHCTNPFEAIAFLCKKNFPE